MSVLLSDFYPPDLTDLTLLISGNLNISGAQHPDLVKIFQTGVNDNIYNSNTALTINSGFRISGLNLKNNDIINFLYTESEPQNLSKSKTQKINPNILIDAIPGKPVSRNYIPFSGTHPLYSGKAIKKVRYNSTIGNGYERFLLNPDSNNVFGIIPIIKPKTRRLETFYDINVPSGGGTTRFIKFELPDSFPFVQGQVMNLKFNFQADSTPCVVSGIYINNNIIYPVFTLSGANYSFTQKQRVILIHNSADGVTQNNLGYEFRLW
jgi:hypothetical protein